jgi:hypothetical protein
MKSSLVAAFFWLLWSTGHGQPTAPTVAPSKGPSSPVPTFGGGGDAGSDQCANNAACAALGITGLCCPTTSSQFLYCCGGVQEETCAANDRCNDLGLTGTCCPTAGHRRAALNGIYLDCCDTIPDACAMMPSSNHTNGTATLSHRNATNRATREGTNESSSCVQQTAVEYQKELAAVESSSRSGGSWTLAGIVFASSVGASVWVLG